VTHNFFYDIIVEIVRQVGYLPELYEDARSEKYKFVLLFHCLFLQVGTHLDSFQSLLLSSSFHILASWEPVLVLANPWQGLREMPGTVIACVQHYAKFLRPVSPVHLMRVSNKVARSMKQRRSVGRKLDA